MNTIILCLIITASVVYIWDYSGFVPEFSNYVAEILSKGKIKRVTLRKPWGCSVCMSTWITLIVLLFLNWKLAPLCLVCGWLAPYMLYTMQTVDMLIEKIFKLLQQLIK